MLFHRSDSLVIDIAGEVGFDQSSPTKTVRYNRDIKLDRLKIL